MSKRRRWPRTTKQRSSLQSFAMGFAAQSNCGPRPDPPARPSPKPWNRMAMVGHGRLGDDKERDERIKELIAMRARTSRSARKHAVACARSWRRRRQRMALVAWAKPTAGRNGQTCAHVWRHASEIASVAGQGGSACHRSHADLRANRKKDVDEMEAETQRDTEARRGVRDLVGTYWTDIALLPSTTVRHSPQELLAQAFQVAARATNANQDTHGPTHSAHVLPLLLSRLLLWLPKRAKRRGAWTSQAKRRSPKRILRAGRGEWARLVRQALENAVTIKRKAKTVTMPQHCADDDQPSSSDGALAVSQG